jgi:uncharacterized protein
MTRTIVVAVFVASLLAGVMVSYAAAQTLPWREDHEPIRETARITVGDHALTVELSVSSAQQGLGLGYRNTLADGHGMLFVDEIARPRTFWMKGMRFCIDIIWIEGGQIIGAAEAVCPDPLGTGDGDRARYHSEQPVTFVLETRAGWLAEHGYGPGTPVEIPQSVYELDR